MITKEIVYKIIEAGMQAPSGDNLQPWRFRWDGADTIEIDVDITIDKSLYNIVYHSQKLVSLIAAGAVIGNMRICANYLGYNLEVVYFPYPEGKRYCAAKILLNEGRPDKELSFLYPYILKRCVNRKIYDGRKIENGIRERIEKEVRDYSGIRLYWLEDKDKLIELASLVRKADRIMFENKDLLLPLMQSIRWTKKEEEATRDGMSLRSLELGWFKSKGFHLFSFWKSVKILNYFGLSNFASLQSLKLIKSASAVCLLGIVWKGDIKDYICVGEALQRIWPVLSSLGIAVQPFAGLPLLINRQKLLNGEGLSSIHRAQIVSFQEGFYNIFGLNKEELPVILLRIGYASSPSSRSLRKKVETFLN